MLVFCHTRWSGPFFSVLRIQNNLYAPYALQTNHDFETNLNAQRKVEIASPQICGPDGEIWLEFIKRDVPGWEKKDYEPRNPKKWYKAYRQLRLESQREIERDAEELKATMDRIKEDQAKHKAEQVELNIVKVPEGMKSNGRIIKLSRTPRFYDKGVNPPPGERQRQKADAGRTTLNNKGKLFQIRKEAKAMGHFQKNLGRPGIDTPRDTRLQPATVKRTPVTAPRGLIEEHRKPAAPIPIDPSVRVLPIFAPKRKRVEYEDAPESKGLSAEEKEKRLKVFTNPSSINKSLQTAKEPTTPTSYSPTSTALPTTNMTEPTFSSSPMPKIKVTSSSSPPAKSIAPVLQIPRPKTSSPINGAARPPMQLKKKAPVDVFMPSKRRRIN